MPINSQSCCHALGARHHRCGAPEEKTSGSRKLSRAHSSCRLFCGDRQGGGQGSVLAEVQCWQSRPAGQKRAVQAGSGHGTPSCSSARAAAPHLQRRAGDEHAVVGLQQAHHLGGGGRRGRAVSCAASTGGDWWCAGWPPAGGCVQRRSRSAGMPVACSQRHQAARQGTAHSAQRTAHNSALLPATGASSRS